jgi:hypothetical protein
LGPEERRNNISGVLVLGRDHLNNFDNKFLNKYENFKNKK